MSEARERYYKNQCIDVDRGVCDASDYVSELEADKAELIDTLKKIQDSGYCMSDYVEIKNILDKHGVTL